MTEGAPRAAVVSVGNELLYGETVDTNAAWLGRELARAGLVVVKRYTVGDVAEDIAQAVRDAAEVADLVLVSGGLGPTPDDLTKATVADAFGMELTVDPGVLKSLERRVAAGGRDDLPDVLRGQAEIPVGSVALENPEGTAPGILLRTQGAVLVLLPGVPRELRAITTGALRPHLTGLLPAGGERAWHRVLHTTGIVESRLTELVEECLERLEPEVREPVSLAYLPDVLGVDLRFSVRATTESEADALIAPLVQAIDDVIAPYRYEAPSGDLADALTRELRVRHMTIAVAESCTGGLVAKRLTDLAGSSDVFLGGVVAYSNRVKVEQVGVVASDLEDFGAVSEAVAGQLATGVATTLGADVGIGVTGIAGPGGGSEEKPVGTVWIGTSVRGEVETFLARYPGDRTAVRARSAQAALAAVYRRLSLQGEG